MHLFAKARHVLAFVAASPEDPMKSIMLSFMALFLLMSPSARAQGVGSSGQIKGTVYDPSGSVIPSATVEAVDTTKGTRYTAVSDVAGQYQFAILPPSTYDVTSRFSGLQTQVQKGLLLQVGQTAIVDFHLALAGTKVEMEVSAELPAIETTRGSQAETISQTYVDDLPINRRDYLTFTLLLPGVSNSNTIADNADFRVKQTPQSGLSFYGSNGRGNSVTVDGGEFNDDAGGVRLNLSQDAVQEFQVNRSNYTAELGGASGASINIVSKSGGNELHGNFYGLFRGDGLDARDHFALQPALLPGDLFLVNPETTATPIKNSLSRQQFGGNLGFPLKKDRMFLYVGYEGLRSDAEDSVPLLTNSSVFNAPPDQTAIFAGLATLPGNPNVPCLSDPLDPINGPPTFFPAQTCAFILSHCLNITAAASPCQTNGATQALNPFIINQAETNGGLFPFPIREHQASARLDYHFSDRNQAFLRYSFAHLEETDPDVQALTGISRGTSELAWDSTLQGSWFHSFSPTTQNELRLQWNMYQFNVNTNDPGGPGIDVQGFGFFNRGIFLPSHTRAGRYEIADNFSMVRGHHTFKFGASELIRGNNTTSQTFFAGRFEFLELPGIVLSPCLQEPIFCGLPPGPSPTTGLTVPASSALSPLQAYSLGAPGFYEQGFGNPQYQQTRPFTALFAQDTWQIAPNLTLNYGLRYEVDTQYGTLHTPKKNFAPRVSLAWDPFGDHKTVVRAGYGIFYSQIYAQIPGVVATLGNINDSRKIANSLVKLTGVPGDPGVANSAAIFQTLFGEGKINCGTPPAGQVACVGPADLEALGLNIQNTGPLPPGTVLFAGQSNYKSPMSQQASLGIEHDWGGGVSVSANYVYVHTTHLPVAIDTNLLPGAPTDTIPFSGLPSNGNPIQDWGSPVCFTNPSPCFADSSLTILQNNVYSSIASAVYNGGIFELRKRYGNHFTAFANYTFSKAIDDSTDFNSDYSPFNGTCLRCERSLSDFDQRHKIVLAGVFDSPFVNSKIFGGFQLAPIFSYNSGHPFNLLAAADTNSDGHFTNDRPAGAGRNTGIGPSYTNFDLRLSRSFKLTEHASVLITAEGFNLANHTNFSSVNNVVGPQFAAPFNVHGSADLFPNQPLAFTAAFPAREFQMGARFTF
jgi:Carboxypeptidase regulatory-like domain/TonB dependent receptor